MLATLTRRQVGLVAAWAAVQAFVAWGIYICWTHLRGSFGHRAWQVALPLLCLIAVIYAVLRTMFAAIESPTTSLAVGGAIGAGAIAALLSAAPGLAWAVGVLMGIFMTLIATATLRALFASDPAKRKDAREVLSILTRQTQDSQTAAPPDAGNGGGSAQGQNQSADAGQNTAAPPAPGP
ncbi:hypothetical protein [Streptomyces sp. NPDC047043]|uniref:hypothetical protein n=1 Tax=Streptomyces sp. NPDC047043 TaxID=3154497 RepID=UPI0033E3AC67